MITEVVPYEENTDLVLLADTAKKEKLLGDVDKQIKENTLGANMYLTSPNHAKLAVEFHRNIIELLRLKLHIIESLRKKGSSSTFEKVGDNVVIISEDGAKKITSKLSGLLYK